LEERQRAEQEQRRRQALTAQRDRIEDGSNAPVMGNPDGDVTLVEFFDYNCPYCKRMTDALRTLIDEDSGLRVVMREYPILSEGSRFAARAALAAKKQGKYEAFHFALMDAKGRVGEQETIDIASRLGLDIERLRADMESPEIQAHIDETYALAQALGVRGTPAFIVGDELVPGATSLEQLRAMVSESRKES
jgi:protein-disulfide isomerase